MRHTHLIRIAFSHIIMFCCLAGVVSSLTACHEDGHYLGTQEERLANGFYIDKIRTHIETAGFYYDEAQKGYNVFICDNTENIRKGQLSDYRGRRYLSFDLPEEAFGKRVQLNDLANLENNYKFQLFLDHIPALPHIMVGMKQVKSGYVEFVVFDEWIDPYTKRGKIDLRLETVNDHLIEVNYVGEMQICNQYIGWWGYN